MLTKEQLQAAANAIDAFTDKVGAEVMSRDPACAKSHEFTAAILICTAMMVALSAMADAAPQTEEGGN